MPDPAQIYQRNAPFAKPGPYVTALNPMQEGQFQSWVKANNVPFEAQDQGPTPTYDMRGYWKDVASQGKSGTAINPVDKQLHFPDTYKTPYHESFSAESKYATPDNPFKWSGETLMDTRTGTPAYQTQPQVTPEPSSMSVDSSYVASRQAADEAAAGRAMAALHPDLLSQFRNPQTGAEPPQVPVTYLRGNPPAEPAGAPSGGDLMPLDLTKNPPPGLIQAMVGTESGGDPNAVSPKGAIGLMQVMPETGREMGYTPEQLKDPRTNMEAGTRYLMEQYAKFGDWRKALIAYNAGPGRVNNPPAESVDYANTILANSGHPGVETFAGKIQKFNRNTKNDLQAWAKRMGFQGGPFTGEAIGARPADEVLLGGAAAEMRPPGGAEMRATSTVEVGQQPTIQIGQRRYDYGQMNQAMTGMVGMIDAPFPSDIKSAVSELIKLTPSQEKNFVAETLAKVPNGEPGLSVEGRFVVYRGPDGAPVSVADTMQESAAPGAGRVTVAFVTDKSKGVLGAKGAIEVGKKLQEMGAARPLPGGQVTPDTERLLAHVQGLLTPIGGAVPPPTTPEAAIQTLAQKQAAALEKVQAGGRVVEELGNPEAAATVVSEAETQAQARALQQSVEGVYGTPMEPPTLAPQTAAMVQVFGGEATALHEDALNVMRKAISGADVSADQQALLSRYSAFAVQYAKVAGTRSAAGRALEILNPLKPENLRITETAKIAAQLGAGDNPQQLNEMLARLDPQAIARAGRQMGENVKVGGSLWGGLMEYYRANLLSNPRTVVKIGLANAITSLLTIPERAVMARMPGATAEIGEAQAMMHGMVDGFSTAIDFGKRSFASGQAEFDINNGVQFMERGPAITSIGTRWEDTPFGRGIDYLGHILRLPYKGIAGIHQFGEALQASMEEHALVWRAAVDQARDLGLEGPAGADKAQELYQKILADVPPEMSQQAANQARQVLYMGQFGPTGQALANVAKLPGFNLVVPFFRVPANIMKWGLETNSLIGPVMQRAALMGGPSIERDKALAKLSLGATMEAWAAFKVVNGELTGDPPSNPATRQALEEQGVQWNAMKIAGHWIEIPEPVRQPLTLVANAVQLMNEVDDPTAAQIATAVTVATAKSITNASFFKGLADVQSMIQNAEQQGVTGLGARFIGQRAQGFVPFSAAVGGVARSMDPTIRQAQTVLDQIKSNIPVLSGDVPARWDLWGNPKMGLPGVPNNLIFPIHVTAAKLDKTDQAIVDSGANFAKVPDVLPGSGRAGRIFDNPNDPDVGITLTPEEKAQWAQYRGAGLKDQFTQLIDSPLWNGLSKKGQADLLEHWGARAAHGATLRLLAEHEDLMAGYVARRAGRKEALFAPSTAEGPLPAAVEATAPAPAAASGELSVR